MGESQMYCAKSAKAVSKTTIHLCGILKDKTKQQQRPLGVENKSVTVGAVDYKSP